MDGIQETVAIALKQLRERVVSGEFGKDDDFNKEALDQAYDDDVSYMAQ